MGPVLRDAASHELVQVDGGNCYKAAISVFGVEIGVFIGCDQ